MTSAKLKLPPILIVASSIVALFILASLFAPWISGSADTPDIRNAEILKAPEGAHWFGTDFVGRDVFARLLYGLRNSLFFSFLVVFVCATLGTLIGSLMGFLGGKFDIVLSRLIEIIGNFPIFMLQLTLLAFFQQSYWILLFVMTINGWVGYARFARAEVLHLRHQEFVLAAESLGASKARVLIRHLMPNALTPLLINIPFDLSSTIVALGALSFLGFGEPPNVASVGELLKQAQDHFQQAWWLAVFPGSFLFLLTVSLSLMGSGLRDWLDPRSQK